MEKKKYTYDLTFEEVLEEIWYKDCWYQGNNFADGVVIFANADGICKQMYRRVYTQPDAERKI